MSMPKAVQNRSMRSVRFAVVGIAVTVSAASYGMKVWQVWCATCRLRKGVPKSLRIEPGSLPFCTVHSMQFSEVLREVSSIDLTY